MKKKRKLIAKITALLMALCVALGCSVSVSAITLPDIIRDSFDFRFDEQVNLSYLSEDKIYLGESVTIYAVGEGLKEARCEYAYSVRQNLLLWHSLETFCKNNSHTWTPQAPGDYEICVKIRCGFRTYKKYMKLKVIEELTLQPMLSSTLINRGDSVTLTARTAGGEGAVQQAYYYRPTGTEDWTPLSDYSEATAVTWQPQQTGSYDICIKAKDEGDQLKEEYYALNVEECGLKNPAVFTITVKAPIASPYLWQCESAQDGILEVEVNEQPATMDELSPVVPIEYRFVPKGVGSTIVTLRYDTHNGTEYILQYDITVDRNLSWTLNEVSGTYSEEELPAPQKMSVPFAVTVPAAGVGHRWKWSVSDPLVAAQTSVEITDDGQESFRFEALRKGIVTVNLTCVSVSDMSEQYALAYALRVDENLHIDVQDAYGFYREDEELPALQVLQPSEESDNLNN